MKTTKMNATDRKIAKAMKRAGVSRLRYGTANTYPGAYKYLSRAPGKPAAARVVEINNGRTQVHVHEFTAVKYKAFGRPAHLYDGVPAVADRTSENKSACRELGALLQGLGYYPGNI